MQKDGNDGQNAKKNQWKNQDKIYLFELQKFFDVVENVKNEELRKEIIAQMLKCDKRITQLAETIFQELKKNSKMIKFFCAILFFCIIRNANFYNAISYNVRKLTVEKDKSRFCLYKCKSKCIKNENL